MKITTLILYISFLLFGYFGKAQQITHPVTVSSSDVSLEQIGNFDLVELKDARYLVEDAYVGQPQLPVKI